MVANVAIVNGYFDPYSSYAIWKYCERKDRYPDEATALWYLEDRQKRYVIKGPNDMGPSNLVVYFCTNCRGYHMGHKPNA